MYINIIELIKKDIKSKKDKYVANKYYYYKPKEQKEITIDIADSQGQIKTITLDKKVCLYTNYFRMLVDQKIDYLLTKNPTISKLPFTITQIVEMYEQLMLNASLDGRAWLHFYIENNTLDWVIVKDCEIIAVFDSHNKNIMGIIRYYFIDEDTIKVEQWEKSGVETALIKKDKLYDILETTHYQKTTSYNDEILDTENSNFSMIPFIPFNNNRELESDIESIKELLDYYNDISSGFIDNVYKFQEALIKLKGFSGDTEILDQTLKSLKKYKMVGIPNDGDMEYMSIDIPVEARKILLDMLKDNIFRIGRAYDPDKIGDGNITNIVIKSRYFQLDNKCNKLEKQAKLFHEKFIEFIGSGNTEIEFNRTQLFNESEKITDCVNSIDLVIAGILSKQTLIAQIPYVNDVKEELKLIEDEGQNPINEDEGQNPPNDEGDNDNE
jgi:SPP1 family phage portal protein